MSIQRSHKGKGDMAKINIHSALPLVILIALSMDKVAPMTALHWISQPGDILVLEGTKLVLNWTHPIQSPMDITWDYKGTDSRPVLDLIMSYTTGAGVYIPIQDQWHERVGYDQSINGSAIMTLDNVTSADEKYFEVNIMSLENQAIRLKNTVSIQIISASTFNMTVSSDGKLFSLSMIENGTNISLPDFIMTTAPLTTDITVQVDSAAPKPQIINFDNYVGGIIQDTMYCERSYCCERLVEFNLGTSQTGELVINISFAVQNLPPIVISRAVRLNVSAQLDTSTTDIATAFTTLDEEPHNKVDMTVGLALATFIILVTATVVCICPKRRQNSGNMQEAPKQETPEPKTPEQETPEQETPEMKPLVGSKSGEARPPHESYPPARPVDMEIGEYDGCPVTENQ